MDISEWRGGTAKLYLALLFSPGHAGTQAELMRRLGTSNRHTLYDAIEELRAAGCVETTQGRVEMTRHGVEMTQVACQNNTGDRVETTPRRVETTLPSVETTPGDVETTPNPRTRCAEADRSRDRTTQLKALSFAFSVRFPGHDIPSVESLKRLLQMTGNSAETVDDAFERASARKPESPFSYVRKMLEGSPPVAIGPTRPAAQPPDDELQPVPEELRAKWKRDSEKMRRLGILPADGGDTWED